MKKISLILSAIVLSSISYGQIVPDKDQWTCKGVNENLYTQLNAGKVVFLTMQGLDCPGCAGNAKHIDSFATNNKAKVRTWAGLQMKSGSGGICAQVDSWEQSYGYSDVFTFLDSANYWPSNYPGAEYLVISPIDKKVKYKGLNINTAFAEARKIFDPTSVKELIGESNVSIYPNPAQSTITINVAEKIVSVSIMSVVGQTVLQQKLTKGKHSIDISNFSNGIYVVKVIAEDQQYQMRLEKR